MINKETLIKEMIKNGYSKERGINVWDISDRSFRYINEDMAKSYLKLRDHPRYKATVIDIEKNLIKENAKKIVENIKENRFNLIDLGATNGEKAICLIKTLPKELKIRYCPVNVNEHLVENALENVKREKFTNIEEYAPRISKNFESLDEIGAALRNNNYQKNVLLMLGSLISSFEINDYLFRLNVSMLPGDILLIGNGIRKGERFTNLENYKHPLFNEWLIHLMKELGLKENEVEYNARFSNERLEAYYILKTDKVLEHEKQKVELKKGDEIIVAFQYKLFANELKNFCDMYFDEVKIFHDTEEEYALVFCKK